MVLLEAMAAELSLVASDIDGYRNVAAGHAQLVPPGEVEALASAQASALDDAAAQRGRSAPEALAATRRHAEGWSMVELAQRYVGIYERVLEETGTGHGPR
jgi:glycosyltransferase involved in cell wall biosynthesis